MNLTHLRLRGRAMALLTGLGALLLYGKWSRRSLVAILPFVFTTPIHAQSSRGAAVAVTVASECGIQVISSAGMDRQLLFRYKLRAAATGGQIVLRVDTTRDLEYKTELSGPGVAVSGVASPSVARDAGIILARFAPHTNTTRSGATGSVRFEPSTSVRNPVLSIACN